LRIKAAYATMRGRCPECGSRVEPLRSPFESGSPPLHTGDGDLVPIEEEWPEPARIEQSEEGPSYSMTTRPPQWEEPQPSPPPTGAGYALAESIIPLAPAPSVIPPCETPYEMTEITAATLPVDPGLADPGREAELIRQPPPPPPRFVLWTGLYGFPWRQENLGVWFYLGVNFSLLAIIGTAMLLLFILGGAYMIGVPLLLPFAGFVFFWTGIYVTTCFLAIVEDTAAGNDQVSWPKGGGLIDGLGKLVFCLWMGGCSFAPVALIWMTQWDKVAQVDLGLILALLPGLVLFPIQLLSVLTADSWWKLIDSRVVFGLLRKPSALFLMCVPSLILLTPCVWLNQMLLNQPNFLVAVGSGFVWSAFVLIYGRILGRTGWILTDGGVRKRLGKKKPRLPKTMSSQPGWGHDDEVTT
jgi:hypothetical protein